MGVFAISDGPLAVVYGWAPEGTLGGTLGSRFRWWAVEISILIGREIANEAGVSARSCTTVVRIHDAVPEVDGYRLTVSGEAVVTLRDKRRLRQRGRTREVRFCHN